LSKQIDFINERQKKLKFSLVFTFYQILQYHAPVFDKGVEMGTAFVNNSPRT